MRGVRAVDHVERGRVAGPDALVGIKPGRYAQSLAIGNFPSVSTVENCAGAAGTRQRAATPTSPPRYWSW
jgi:hypothetical protein